MCDQTPHASELCCCITDIQIRPQLILAMTNINYIKTVLQRKYNKSVYNECNDVKGQISIHIYIFSWNLKLDIDTTT